MKLTSSVRGGDPFFSRVNVKPSESMLASVARWSADTLVAMRNSWVPSDHFPGVNVTLSGVLIWFPPAAVHIPQHALDVSSITPQAIIALGANPIPVLACVPPADVLSPV